MRSLFPSQTRSLPRRLRATRTRHMSLERLEGRELLSGIGVSVGDASAVEGEAHYRFVDNFVAPDAYGLAAARNIRIGPDGNVYIASHDTNVVKVFEPGTGRFLRDLGTSGGELVGPWGMTFGPDGLLYVGGRYSLNVVRFDITTGAYDVIVNSANSGGLGTARGLTFGPDGSLYVSSEVPGAPTATDTVKRFNGATGAYIDDFVGAGSGGLDNANGVTFGPDGNLYVASSNNDSVLRYNGQTGQFKDVFIAQGAGGLSQPSQLHFNSSDGLVYVCSGNSQQILRFNATTGAFLDVFAAGRQLHDIAFDPSGVDYVSQSRPTLQQGSAVLRYAPSSFVALPLNLSAPASSVVSVTFATNDGSALSGSDFVGATGRDDFSPGETTRTVLIKTLNDNIVEPTETFTLEPVEPGRRDHHRRPGRGHDPRRRRHQVLRRQRRIER